MIILKRVVKLIHIRHSASAFCDKIRPYRKNTGHISCHKIGNILPFSLFLSIITPLTKHHTSENHAQNKILDNNKHTPGVILPECRPLQDNILY